MKNILVLISMSVCFLPHLIANNVTLSNISLIDQDITGHYCNIKFDIAWDNSWRTSTSVPGNWDACWLFAKFRVNNGPWHHCMLSSAAGDHTAPSGSTISPSTDGLGVFIYRSSDGNGNNSWTNAKLRWNYGNNGVPDDALLEVRLFAIEMVYIPLGEFFVGDGNGTDESMYAFHQGTSNSAVQVNTSLLQNIRVDDASTYDDAQLKNPGIGIKGDGGLDVNNDGTIENNEYPTGYRQFYIMKYELSQDQYAEFLNTLTRTQQMAHVESDISGTSVSNFFVMVNSTTPEDFNVIRCDATIPPQPAPVIFYCDYDADGVQESCDALCLPGNYTSWRDGAAYADWAGLRPMTELEFEKVTRGPNTPVFGEYSWGNTNIATSWYQYILPGCPNSNIILDPEINTGRACYSLTTYEVPYRCGIFAATSDNHTRQEAGAGYYGVMEMSGNVVEPVVNVGNVAGRSYRAINGNGELNAAGYADVNFWPGINGNNDTEMANTAYGGVTGVTGSAGSGIKGGSYSTTADYLKISQRYYASSSYSLTRQPTDSHRFVRNAF